MLYFLRLTVFFQRHCLIPVFPVIAMQRFDFKNSIIAIKLFLVMILNINLTSEIRSQNDLKVSLIL